MDVANKNQKIKNIIDFADQDTANIKSLCVKASDKVKITTLFMKGKMLMFSKILLKAFVYDLIDYFCFPDEKVQEIYARNEILRCFIYLILTDTDSCSIQFLFVSNLKSTMTEDQTRKLIFEMILLKIGHRIDTSHDFYANFLCQNKKLKKQVGLYEVESSDNANIITSAVNPKEYFEIFRFQIKNTMMQLTAVRRKQFAGLNDKRFYLSNGITSLPYGHFLLSEIRDEKKQYKHIHRKIMQIKYNLLR